MCIITSVILNGADAGVAIETLRARDTWFAVEPKPDGLYKVHFTDDEGHQDAIAQHLKDVQPEDGPAAASTTVSQCPTCQHDLQDIGGSPVNRWCPNCGTLVSADYASGRWQPDIVDGVQRIAIEYPQVAGSNNCPASGPPQNHACPKCEIYHLLEQSGVCVFDDEPPPGFKDSMGNEY